MFDLSLFIDLVRDNPAVTGLIGTGAVGGLFLRSRRRQARRIDQEAGVPTSDGSKSSPGLFGRLVAAVDQFMKNREMAKRRFEVLKQTVGCQDPDRRKDIAELEKVWTVAETQQALNAKITAELEMPNRLELESAGQDPPLPNRGSRQGRRR